MIVCRGKVADNIVKTQNDVVMLPYTTPKTTVQQLLLRHYTLSDASGNLHVQNVLHRIMICRMAALGYHVYRICSINEDDTVTFDYKDYADGNEKKQMTLSCTEFIRRF